MMAKIHTLVLAMSGMLTSSLLSTYDAWKAKQIQAWQESKKESFAAQVADLAAIAEKNIESYEYALSGKWEGQECLYNKDGFLKALLEISKQEVLNAYNYLRELLHVPLTTEPQEIDRQWLYDVSIIARHYNMINLRGWYFPTLSQSQLIQQAQETLGVKEIILPAAIFNIFDGESIFAVNNYYILTLGQLPDLHERLFVLYHELAHVIFKDSLAKTYARDSDNDIPQEFFEDPLMQHVADQVLVYTQRGIQALDNDTALGQELHRIMAHHNTFWDTSQLSDKVYRYLLFHKTIEARADLFAFQKLYEQRKLETILHIINRWVTSGYRVIEDEDEHPSDIERAFYTLGFLVDKGVDVNKAFQEWQVHGTCGNTLVTCPSFFSAESKGTADFQKAYDDWSKTHQGYEYWKQVVLAQWLTEQITSLDHKVEYLAELVKRCVRNLKELPSYPIYQQEALYSYNFLRELLQLPLADSFAEIDHAWLDAQSYTFWKNSMQTLFDTSLPTLEVQIIPLIGELHSTLIQYRRFPKAPEHQEKALYAYNFLQGMLGRDLVTSFNDIDHVWIQEQTYTSFKALVKQEWSNQGIIRLIDQVNDIIERRLKLWVHRSEKIVQENSISRGRVLLNCKLLKELVPALPEIHSWQEINSDFYDTVRSLAAAQESTPYVQMDTPTFIHS
jgi:hypothetical protein